jgi:hypothetical protein
MTGTILNGFLYTYILYNKKPKVNQQYEVKKMGMLDNKKTYENFSFN